LHLFGESTYQLSRVS